MSSPTPIGPMLACGLADTVDRRGVALHTPVRFEPSPGWSTRGPARPRWAPFWASGGSNLPSQRAVSTPSRLHLRVPMRLRLHAGTSPVEPGYRSHHFLWLSESNSSNRTSQPILDRSRRDQWTALVPHQGPCRFSGVAFRGHHRGSLGLVPPAEPKMRPLGHRTFDAYCQWTGAQRRFSLTRPDRQYQRLRCRQRPVASQGHQLDEGAFHSTQVPGAMPGRGSAQRAR